eukprot:5894889-Amphidinium_carterae.1
MIIQGILEVYAGVVPVQDDKNPNSDPEVLYTTIMFNLALYSAYFLFCLCPVAVAWGLIFFTVCSIQGGFSLWPGVFMTSNAAAKDAVFPSKVRLSRSIVFPKQGKAKSAVLEQRSEVDHHHIYRRDENGYSINTQ